MRAFEPSRLFEARPGEDRRRAAPYRTLAAELDAVRSRRKAMSMFPFDRPGASAEDDADLRALMNAASARGLAVIVHPDELFGLPRGMCAFVLPLDQAWRVPALLALWQTALEGGAWSDAAERQTSFLLGYGDRERRAWMARTRHRVAAWGARTIYTLLDGAGRRRIDELGRRCLGPAAAIEGMTFFAHARGHALVPDAARRAPAGHAIARVGVEAAAYDALLGRARPVRGVVSAIAGRRAAAEIAAGLRSNVELLGARGWRSARDR
ncbi:MAG TPA: hypothetical protein VN253_00090 [Kofleriaceae bacterium]|nr:hypothetical protein [Kofleriaceae bacterium]